MLILSRKKGERIFINDDLILEVVEIKHNRIRLGIVGSREKYVVVKVDNYIHVPKKLLPPEESKNV